MDTLRLLVPDEQEAVITVANDELEMGKILENIKAKVLRDSYPFSICVDGIASR